MSTHTIDVVELHGQVDAVRQAREITWTQVAAEVDCPQSAFTRMGKGFGPSADLYVSLLGWLGMPAPFSKESK